jgi:hypothetical protein
MAVWYLDNDDEITDAVARLRGASDGHVVFVVPPGSRIATGRINFKLLAREAETRELHMAIASPDEQVRALATSAGVIAAATADEAEEALLRGDEPPDEGDITAVHPAAHPAEPVAALEPAPSEGERPLLSWRSQRLRVVTVLVLVIAIIGIFTALQTLPTAEITLAPRLATLGPLEVPVAALPTITEPDVDSGHIPAVEIAIPLIAEESFPSTDVVKARSTGTVVFSASEQLTDQDIEAGTRLETPGGVEFQTTELVTLPPSAGGVSEVTAPIEAIVGGEEGDVGAEAISIAPSLSQRISVSNPEPTSGGDVVLARLVARKDYDEAAVYLKNQLEEALEAYVGDPANTPEGLTLFTETARLGSVSYGPAADEIVGSSAPEFTLGGSAAARVLAVDESLVDEVTRARLLGTVSAGQAILDGSVVVGHGEGSVEGDRIRFEGSAEAAVYPLVDTEDVLEQIAGLPVSDARAILEGFGTATVNVWPDFLGDLPGARERITLDLLEPATTE